MSTPMAEAKSTAPRAVPGLQPDPARLFVLTDALKRHLLADLIVIAAGYAFARGAEFSSECLFALPVSRSPWSLAPPDAAHSFTRPIAMPEAKPGAPLALATLTLADAAVRVGRQRIV